MTKPSKKLRIQTQLSERRLITSNIEKYNHMISIGFSRAQAVKRLRKESIHMPGTEKLRQRLDNAKIQFGTTGITLKGIRLTKDVTTFIKDLEKADVIEPYKKGQDVLILKHPRIWSPK